MARESRTIADRACVDPADDAAIIETSRREPEAFAELFHRHAPHIGRYVVRRLGQGQVDDIVAETFLTAFERRKSFDLTRPDARPWLFGIATNVIRRHRREEVRLLRAVERTGIDVVIEPFTDHVDARVSAHAATRRLAAAIARLPAAQREVLLLIAWTDLTHDQAAEALGVPAGTVHSRMNRAKTKLREALGGIDPVHAQEEDQNNG